MEKKDFFFGIVSSKIFKNSRQQWIKNTWLKNLNYIFISDIDDEDNKKFSENCDYSSGEEKVLNSYKFIWENYNQAKWFIFCDDDTYLNINNLEKFIKDCELQHFGCVMSKDTHPQNTIWAKESHDFKYYSGGAGYVFNNETLGKIHSVKVETKTGWGDAATAHIFKKLKIQLNNCDKMNYHDPFTLNHDTDRIKRSISYHYLQNQELMNQVHAISQN